MPENKIDLSPLDPTNHKNRFDATVTALTRKILAAREITAMALIARRGRIILAAAISVLVIMGSLLLTTSPLPAETE